MSTEIIIRDKWDRLRYAILLEITLLALIVPGVAYVLDRSLANTGVLSIILTVKALLLSMLYNYVYDRIDVYYSRVPSERSLKGRIYHAVGFECTLTITSLPIVIWWFEISFLKALVLDASLMAWVVVHTFFFTMAYDRLFPVAQPQPVAAR